MDENELAEYMSKILVIMNKLEKKEIDEETIDIRGNPKKVLREIGMSKKIIKKYDSDLTCYVTAITFTNNGTFINRYIETDKTVINGSKLKWRR
ncbi:hypothetical protein LCGC14_1360050 [marine sediment metagenome]|uniref:Uncharacterized protein n=1 Tax=marine sediment metagenome TaxID=412755 RepID=A0A0F9NAN9_9ZZZZ